jgi:hypothetical protein
MGAITAILPSIIDLITQYGVPAAKQLWTMFTQPTGPTPADWTALEAACAVNARQQMLATLAAHNIDPASPAGVAFLALTPA